MAEVGRTMLLGTVPGAEKANSTARNTFVRKKEVFVVRLG